MLGILSNTIQVATRMDHLGQNDMPRSAEEVSPSHKRRANPESHHREADAEPTVLPGYAKLLNRWFRDAFGVRRNFNAEGC